MRFASIRELRSKPDRRWKGLAETGEVVITSNGRPVAMHLVPDTNLLVSRLLSGRGAPAQVLEQVRQGVVVLCADERILQEYEEVLLRPELPFARRDVEILVGLLRETCQIVSPRPLARRLPDPDDEPFLEAAIAGKAILTTGNLRHYPASARAGIGVLSPSAVLELIRKSGASTPP